MQFSLKQTKTHTKNSEINLNNIFVDVKAKRTTKKTKAAWCASPPPGGVQAVSFGCHLVLGNEAPMHGGKRGWEMKEII